MTESKTDQLSAKRNLGNEQIEISNGSHETQVAKDRKGREYVYNFTFTSLTERKLQAILYIIKRMEKMPGSSSLCWFLILPISD